MIFERSSVVAWTVRITALLSALVLVPGCGAQARTGTSTHSGDVGEQGDGVSNVSGAPLLLKGEVGSFGALSDELQTDLGLQVARTGARGEITIRKVRLGTEAYYQGLTSGDRLLSAQVNGNKIALTVDRDGRMYTATLTRLGVRSENLSGQVGSVDGLRNPALMGKPTKFPVFDVHDPKLAQQRMKVLASYNLVLVIDRSGSMDTNDCPGGVSRWDWCKEQATGLVRALAPFVPSGVTLVTFNHDFDVHENVKVEDIERVFDTEQPAGNTDLVDPLKNRLENYFATRQKDGRPLLLAVITDGLPNRPSTDPSLVRNALIDASLRMIDPREICVTFLEIGDFGGQQCLIDLDDNLVNDGGRFDIVDTKTFEELKSLGLPQALVDAVLESGDHNKPRHPVVDTAQSRGMDQRYNAAKSQMMDALNRATNERLKLERELLNQRH
ncbi:MAG: VWA domain-containing protein [Terriglobales bacterium]